MCLSQLQLRSSRLGFGGRRRKSDQASKDYPRMGEKVDKVIRQLDFFRFFFPLNGICLAVY